MNEYSVGNYTNMENAVSSTTAYVTQVDKTKEVAKKALVELSDTNTFCGPVQEEYIEILGKMNNTMEVLSDNFRKLANYLNTITNNYKNADTTSSNNISNTGN